MKKSLVVLASAFIFTSFFASVGRAETAVITNASGAPMVVRNGQEMPATTGMSVQTSDVLKTNEGCMVDVSLNGKLGCRVLPSSNVLLASANPSDMSVKVNDGNVILNVNKLAGSTFRVETPTAVATVRGTQFWGRVMGPTDASVTTFAVREGTVEILAKNVNQTFTVKAGEAIDIPKTEAVTPLVRPALAQELSAMQQASTVKTSA